MAFSPFPLHSANLRQRKSDFGAKKGSEKAKAAEEADLSYV